MTHSPEINRRRRALVTGATSGIGEAFARRLARTGHDVVLVARRRERLEAVAKELTAEADIEAEVLAADLLIPSERQRVEERLATDASIGLLVNNAGFGCCGRFSEIDPDRLADEIQLNAVASMRLMRAVLPAMLERGQGEIVNVASSTGFQPDPFFANYGATKAYLVNLTQAIADECRGTDVRVVAVCPGPVLTEFGAVADFDDSQLPAFTLVSTDQVVDAALRALRAGKTLCVPGGAMRLTHWITSRLPRFVSSAFYREFGRRYYLRGPRL